MLSPSPGILQWDIVRTWYRWMQRLLGEPLSLKGRATSDPQQCLVGTMEGHTLLQAGLLQPACAAPGGPGKVGAGRGDGLPGKPPHLQSLRPSATSEVKPVPQHPPRGQRFSRRAYLGKGGIEQLAGFVACGGERQPRVLPGLQQQGAPQCWSLESHPSPSTSQPFPVPRRDAGLRFYHGHGGWLSGGVLGRAWEAEGPEPKTALCGPREDQA